VDADRNERLQGLYEEHGRKLLAYALSITRHRESAEDAVHGAIARLASRPWLPRRLAPYAYRCVRNAAIDACRRNGRRRETVFDAGAVADEPGDAALLPHLESLLERLSPDEREAIVLHAIDGLAFREVAAVRRRSINTVASHYRRGLQKLRQLWSETENGAS
jgi:RNA polymerase sigma-70 factor (ECF subfamily)